MSKKSDTASNAVNKIAVFDAFSVRNYERDSEKRSEWTKLGIGFAHQDGKGINVVLQSLPIDGKIVLRLHEPKEDNAG